MGRRRIVCAVNDEASDLLEASGPDDTGKAGREVGQGRITRGKNLEGCESREGVFAIEAARQREVGWNLGFRNQIGRVVKRNSDRSRTGTDDFNDRRYVAAQHHRHARLDDARLLRGDLFHRVSEPVAVVQSDAGDDRERRTTDVGRV